MAGVSGAGHPIRVCEHSQMSEQTRTAFRTCPLCEAGCGLEITVASEADGTESSVAVLDFNGYAFVVNGNK